MEGAHEVDVHHPLDLLHLLLLQLLRDEHAVVADEDVDGARLGERARHGVGVRTSARGPDVPPVAAGWRRAPPPALRRSGPGWTPRPSLAAAVAMASPMPLDPPVMSTCRPLSGIRAALGRARNASAARSPMGGTRMRSERSAAAMASEVELCEWWLVGGRGARRRGWFKVGEAAVGVDPAEEERSDPGRGELGCTSCTRVET